MRLSHKIILGFVLVIILLTIANTLSTSYLLENLQEERLRTEEVLFAKSLSNSFFRDVVEEKTSKLTDILFDEKKLREEKVEYILIFNKKGYLLSHTYLDKMPKHFTRLLKGFHCSFFVLTH